MSGANILNDYMDMEIDKINKPHRPLLHIKFNSAFIFLIIIGFLIKDRYLLILLCSILWEIFEIIISNYKYTREFMLKYWIKKELWDETFINKFGDLIINMLGYYVGNNLLTIS